MSEEFCYVTLTGVRANTLEELLDIISCELQRKEMVADTFHEALVERERVYPTGIGTKLFGVAIPHVDAEHVTTNAICTVTLDKPVAFGLMGGGPQDQIDVECLFVILLHDRSRHMKTLVRFMDILRNDEVLSAIRNSVCEQETRQHLQRYLETGL